MTQQLGFLRISKFLHGFFSEISGHLDTSGVSGPDFDQLAVKRTELESILLDKEYKDVKPTR